MNKEEFNNLVNRYADEIHKYSKKSKSKTNLNTVNSEENKSDEKKENNISYEEFMSANDKVGHLRVHSFCQDGNNVSLEGIRVRIKKNFSDGERIFFDGYTDGDGNINDIILPAPDHSILRDSDKNICPHAVYEVDVFHEDYSLECKDVVNSFDHIETVYPIKVMLTKE